MPTVGGTKFPYTKKGMQKAKAWSEMIGKPIKATPMPKKKGQKSKAKPMPKKKGSVAKATPMKYENGGYAEFNPGDATMTQREALKQEMMSPEYIESIANLAMGTVGGGSGGIFKMIKNLLKKPKAAKDWQKAKDAMIKAGRKDAPATDKTYRPWLDKNATKGYDKVAARKGKPGQTLGRDLDPKDLELFRKRIAGFAGGGQIPQETLLRAMYALGGQIPAGRRMYGMGKKKKSLQTADVGPVRGMKKGGKVKYHV